MNEMNKIYLDNSATTKPDQKVIEVMDRVQKEAWGNPSSIHSVGREAHDILDESRRTVAGFLNCQPEEIIFTSGGSESDNFAIRGIIEKQSSGEAAKQSRPHIITSAVEHHAVLHTVQELEKEGRIEATYIKPDSDGIISPEMVVKEIRDNTILVSLIYVNNETGVTTPIAEIGERITTYNLQLTTKKKSQRIFFHTDAVQAAEFMSMDVKKLGVDLLTLSGHKFHGPKGVGVLYVRKGVKLKPQITGGSHEFNIRAGTENVAAIAGLAAALSVILTSPSLSLERRGIEPEDDNYKSKVEHLRDKLENSLLKNIPNTQVNGSKEKRAPHISNISFINAEGEAIILNLDFVGIQVSSGSACTSRSLEPSHVLTAMGVPPEKAHGSIRFSLSRETTEEEVDYAIEVMPKIIKKLREMSPFK